MNFFRIKQSVLVLAACILLQGCGRHQIRQEENTWSFEADMTETEIPEAETVFQGEEQTSVQSREISCESGLPQGYVYVCGAVKDPGVYEIREGMRVFEAVALAGGMTDDADPLWINQAQAVSDGQMLRIYTKQETDQMRHDGMTVPDGQEDTGIGIAGTREETAPSDGKININTAGREELMTLPGIGETKADAILQYRREHGAFGSIEEICRISGIKEAVFSKIKDRITV